MPESNLARLGGVRDRDAARGADDSGESGSGTIYRAEAAQPESGPIAPCRSSAWSRFAVSPSDVKSKHCNAKPPRGVLIDNEATRQPEFRVE